MPLPPTDAPRTRLHRRRVSFDGFKRADGLWDIEGHLVDRKDHDFPLATGVRKPDESLHEMWIRVTVDGAMNVVAVTTVTDASPYHDACDSQRVDYGRLVGLNLFQGFLKHVKDLFGGPRGCTHVSELLMFVPTAALQTLSSERSEKDFADEKPYHLDRCHALVTDGETVRRYYPRWYRQPGSTSSPAGAPDSQPALTENE